MTTLPALAAARAAGLRRLQRRLMLAWAFALATPALAQQVDFQYAAQVSTSNVNGTLLQALAGDHTQADPANAGFLERQIGLGRDPVTGNNHFVRAAVSNWGNTFSTQADTPWRTTLPFVDSVTLAESEVRLWESFRRSSPTDSMHFTYSYGLLDLYNDREFGNPANYNVALLLWEVTVYLNSDPSNVLWSDAQAAILKPLNGVWDLEVASLGTVGAPNRNPTWQWNCTGCGNAARGLVQASLPSAYRGEVDLSVIPYDPSLAADQQPEFTVHHRLWALANDTGIGSFARAYAQDPVGFTPGASIEVQGLVDTNHGVLASPVPEPASWLLGLVGAAALARRLRRRVGAAGVGLMLCGAGGAAMAQAATLTDRHSQLRGSFVVGYATMFDSGSFNQSWRTLDADFTHAAADAGSVDGTFSTLPVTGLGAYEVSQNYSFSGGGVTAQGRALSTLAALDVSYMSAGASSDSTLWLTLHLAQDTPFTISGELVVLPGVPVQGRTSTATAGVALDAASGPGLWQFTAPGVFQASGVMRAGDWLLYGVAGAVGNGQSAFNVSLALDPAPVPEPAGWALLAVGLPVLLWRRRLAGRPA